MLKRKPHRIHKGEPKPPRFTTRSGGVSINESPITINTTTQHAFALCLCWIQYGKALSISSRYTTDSWQTANASLRAFLEARQGRASTRQISHATTSGHHDSRAMPVRCSEILRAVGRSSDFPADAWSSSRIYCLDTTADNRRHSTFHNTLCWLDWRRKWE
jgi:hypothetical protein